jgi:oligoribonuclease NrnB/cAMP/cGMP phosphodiesterase (DHH superfamily)
MAYDLSKPLEKGDPVTLIYYHCTDNDGRACAAIMHFISQKYPEKIKGRPHFIPFNHGYIANIDGECRYNNVVEIVIADIALDIVAMKKIASMNIPTVWVDHHDTAIDDSVEHGYSWLPGIRQPTGKLPKEQKEGACSLLWKYYFQDTPLPQCIQYISDHDVWKRTYEGDCFDSGARERDWFYLTLREDGTLKNNGCSELMRMIATGEGLHNIMERGAIIESYRHVLFKRIAYRTEIGHLDGLRLLIVNHLGDGSRPLEFLDSPVPDVDAFVAYGRTAKGQWNFGIYRSETSNCDVSLIARKYGGGGRNEAAGFVLKDIDPFFKEIKSINVKVFMRQLRIKLEHSNK